MVDDIHIKTTIISCVKLKMISSNDWSNMNLSTTFLVSSLFNKYVKICICVPSILYIILIIIQCFNINTIKYIYNSV